jgi:hypothetical protein
MLSVGGASTDDFVSLALDEGWIAPEQGTWNLISEESIAKFLQPDNWSLIMELLDERRSQAAAKTAPPSAERTPPAGQLL